MSEKALERKIARAVRLAGGICLKLVPTFDTGIPDRLVVLPGGVVWFVELKATKYSRRTAKQEHWARRLQGVGARYLCAYEFETFEAVVLKPWREESK